MWTLRYFCGRIPAVMFMKKRNKNKTKKTAKQRFQKFINVIISIILVIAVLAGVVTIVNFVKTKSSYEFIESYVKGVKYENQLVPTIGADGFYEFTTDREFRVMHLSDVHLGGGFLSTKKDSMALNCVAAMITAEKPDLVVVTGDVAYPVPYTSGTFNNKTPAVLFAQFMEKLGVYWCIAYGNHDTEAYSFFSREIISEVYENHEKYPHCLFQTGPEDADGCGNYVINVKNSKGNIVQSLFMLDSHSYTDRDYFGIMWRYDCVHENQVKWYESTLQKLTAQNSGEVPKSLMFFHIPIMEMRDAFYEYRDNGFKDTENVKYIAGRMGEVDKVVYSSEYNYGLFDSCLKNGSTQGIFFGHDHLNNMTLNYKGIILSYGYTIDYLAYKDIETYGEHRGCTMIAISPDSGIEVNKENYYQNKYAPAVEKEKVTMGKYYADSAD